MGKVEELASLVSVTKDIFDIDRNMMYSNLLMAYGEICLTYIYM